MPNWKKLVVSGSDASLNSLNVANAVTASNFRSTNGAGTPTLISPNNIILSASNAVVIKDAALRFDAFTNAETGSLTSIEGDVIYNSDRGTLLLYTGSQWTEIVGGGGTGEGFPFTGSAGISGSLIVDGEITGSYFKGDGSGLTNLTFDQAATVVHSFVNKVSESVVHSFNSSNVLVSVYDADYNLFIPERVNIYDPNKVNIEFAETSSGYVVVARGGHILSGSLENAVLLNGESGSFYLDYNNLTNVPSGIVSSSTQVDLAQAFGTASHALTASYAINAGAGAGFPFSGSAEITGSLYVSGSTISGSFVGDGSGLTGIGVVEFPTVSDTFTNVTSSLVNHNFSSKNIIVNVYDENDFVIVPNQIQLLDSSSLQVTFTSPKSGTVVVAKGGHIVSGNNQNSILLNNQSGSYYLDYFNFTNTPTGLISSSAQITELGDITFSGSLYPSVNEAFDLGSPSARWRDLYLSGSTIYLDTTRITRTADGDIEIKDHSNQRKNIVANQIHLGGANGDDLVIHEQNGKIRFKNSRTNQKVQLDNTAVTASFALSANVASTALTASFALNAAGGDSKKQAIYGLVGLDDMYFSKTIIE